MRYRERYEQYMRDAKESKYRDFTTKDMILAIAGLIISLTITYRIFV